MCERLGVAFIGPDSGSMRRLGDKICAKRLAEQAGIPVIPWGDAPADTVEAALAQAERVGYPVALKASGGAGGRAHPACDLAGGSRGGATARSGVTRRASSTTARSSSSAGWPGCATSRCRSRRTATGRSGPSGPGTARCSGGSRSSCRRRRRPASLADLETALHGRRRAARGGGSLPGPGQRRVPRGPVRAVLLPRGEHPAPGRARRHGADQRHRPREARASTSRAAGGSRPCRPPARGTRSRSA